MTTQSTSEADMGYIRDMVSKIAEALVQATELPKRIELMQNDLTALHSDLEKTKARNIELDALVSDIRRQRDEAEQALSQVKAELNQAHQSLTTAENNNHTYSAQLEEFRSRLEQAKKERDDYGLKHMEAEDRAKTAEDKLAKLADALGLPKAQPQPVVAQPEVKPAMPEASPATPNPTPTVEQAISNSPKRVYEGDFGFNDLPYSTEAWDNVTQRYYRTA